jgi:hypothetical protein
MRERLIKDLQRKFKNNEFEIVEIALQRPMNDCWFTEYNSTESLKVDGDQIKFHWLPHLTGMPEEFYSHLLDRVVEGVKEICYNKKQRIKKGIALGPPKNSAPLTYEEKEAC